jgi:hypothetical protein
MARWVRLEARVVEHHGGHRDGLPDRLLAHAGAVELDDEIGDRLRVEPLEWGVAEAR